MCCGHLQPKQHTDTSSLGRAKETGDSGSCHFSVTPGADRVALCLRVAPGVETGASARAAILGETFQSFPTRRHHQMLRAWLKSRSTSGCDLKSTPFSQATMKRAFDVLADEGQRAYRRAHRHALPTYRID